MRVTIIGAGGVGSYYAGLLARSGVEVRLFARGAHLDAVRASGLTVRTPDETFTLPVAATDVAGNLVGSDYAILSVKSYSLPSVAPIVAALAAKDTTIVPLLNGIDIAERLTALGTPRECILEGLTAISAVRVAPGVVERRSPFQRVTVGEANGSSSRRGTTFVAAMERAGVEARLSPEIRLDLWRKFLFLDPLAATCGLVRGPIGTVRASARGHELLAGAVDEVVAVGARSGVPWSATDRDDTLRSLETIPEGTKPSFLLDVERGGPTELDILAGTVARLGREFGVATPVHNAVVQALQTADYGLRTADYGLRSAD